MIVVDLAIKKKLLWWELALSGWALVSAGVIYSLQLHRLWDSLTYSCISLLFVLLAIVCWGSGREDTARRMMFVAVIPAGIGTGLGMAHHGLGQAGAGLGIGIFFLAILWNVHEVNRIERIRRQEETIRKLREEIARLKRP